MVVELDMSWNLYYDNDVEKVQFSEFEKLRVIWTKMIDMENIIFLKLSWRSFSKCNCYMNISLQGKMTVVCLG